MKASIVRFSVIGFSGMFVAPLFWILYMPIYSYFSNPTPPQMNHWLFFSGIAAIVICLFLTSYFLYFSMFYITDIQSIRVAKILSKIAILFTLLFWVYYFIFHIKRNFSVSIGVFLLGVLGCVALTALGFLYLYFVKTVEKEHKVC